VCAGGPELGEPLGSGESHQAPTAHTAAADEAWAWPRPSPYEECEQPGHGTAACVVFKRHVDVALRDMV